MPPKKSCTTTPGTLLSALETVRLAVSGMSLAVTSATPPASASNLSRTVDGDVSRGAAASLGSFEVLAVADRAADLAPALAAARLGEAVALELTMIGSSEIVAPGVADCARQLWLAVDISSASVRTGAMPIRI